MAGLSLEVRWKWQADLWQAGWREIALSSVPALTLRYPLLWNFPKDVGRKAQH